MELREEQSERLEQFQVVLDAYQRRGGEAETYQLYIEALRGVDLKATDAEMLWKNFKGWLRSERGGLLWGGRVLAFFLLLAAARVASGLAASLVKRWLRRTSRMSMLAEKLISRTIRHALMLIGFLLALAAVGVDVGPLLAAVGATGFIIGFALQGTLSNFASGLMILMNRPFDVGDAVEAGGVIGTIEEMTLVSTTFLSFDNQRIIVPNNEIWNKVITNITANKTRRVDLEFGVGYHDDLDRVRAILEQEAGRHPLVLDEPAPVVKMHKISDSSILFICRPWSKTEDYWTVYWELLSSIKQRFDQEGITLPYPQRAVHVHSETSA